MLMILTSSPIDLINLSGSSPVHSKSYGFQKSLILLGDWEESWGRGAEKVVDSKPDGPSAVSLDLAFPASRGLYGLPERASLSTALADTSGKGGKNHR